MAGRVTLVRSRDEQAGHVLVSSIASHVSTTTRPLDTAMPFCRTTSSFQARTVSVVAIRSTWYEMSLSAPVAASRCELAPGSDASYPLRQFAAIFEASRTGRPASIVVAVAVCTANDLPQRVADADWVPARSFAMATAPATVSACCRSSVPALRVARCASGSFSAARRPALFRRSSRSSAAAAASACLRRRLSAWDVAILVVVSAIDVAHGRHGLVGRSHVLLLLLVDGLDGLVDVVDPEDRRDLLER